MKMLNEDISGHLPLKIDVIPAVVTPLFHLRECDCDAFT